MSFNRSSFNKQTPNRVLDGKSPHEILYHVELSYSNFRVFGCLSFAKNCLKTKDKFASCSRKGTHVGHPFRKKGGKIFDLETHEVFVSRDVVFYEDFIPFC